MRSPRRSRHRNDVQSSFRPRIFAVSARPRCRTAPLQLAFCAVGTSTAEPSRGGKSAAHSADRLRSANTSTLIQEESMTMTERQKSAQMIAALDPYHMQVGRIASQWAALDHAIDQAIWKLAEISPALGACITTQLTSTATRLRVMWALLLLRDGSDPLINKLEKFNAKMYVVLEKRNRAVHDPWCQLDSGEVGQIKITLDNKRNLTLAEVPVGLEVVFNDLTTISRQLRNFITLSAEITSWLETSPQKWREPLPQISHFELVSLAP
jgi:hypothetical protein